MFFTIVSEPATPNDASPVVMAPSTLTTAILFSDVLSSFLKVDKYSYIETASGSLLLSLSSFGYCSKNQ